MAITYLSYQQINKAKWDYCIDQANNGLIYAYSYYLDAMAKNWDALVLNDYEAVMPLTWNKKYSIHYLYQPAFTACLGVFGKGINENILNAFLTAIPSKFKYWDIYLNNGNFFKLSEFYLYQRTNFILSLDSNYENIFNGYRDNVKRNLKKSENFKLSISRNIEVSSVIELAKEQIGSFSSVTLSDFQHFEDLFKVLHENEKATTYGIFNNDNQLLASAIFIFSHSRAYYIMVGNHPNGKTLGASHLLIDTFIKDHARQNLVLDFEGSDIPSLAFFYSGFGAKEEKYSAIKLNRLPAPLKWFKK